MTDPLNALEQYYGKQAASPSEDLLANIHATRRNRRRRMFGATWAFTLTALLAAIMLTWAARPAVDHRDMTASAIARYQMIHSGLVEGPIEKGHATR